MSPEKSPAETWAKAQTHANDWNNHLQSDGVVFVPSLTLLPLSCSSRPHPSSQSLFVFLNHSQFGLCVLKRPSVCVIKEGANRGTSIQGDKVQGNVEIWVYMMKIWDCYNIWLYIWKHLLKFYNKTFGGNLNAAWSVFSSPGSVTSFCCTEVSRSGWMVGVQSTRLWHRRSALCPRIQKQSVSNGYFSVDWCIIRWWRIKLALN